MWILLTSLALGSGWPEIGPHPRNTLTPVEREIVSARATRAPYAGWVRELHALAGGACPSEDDSIAAMQVCGNQARAAAWLFYADLTVVNGEIAPFPDEAARRDMGARAATRLLSMYTQSRAKGIFNAVEDIHTAQELHLWADTLDLLLGANLDVLGAQRAAAVQGVADLAADFYGDFYRAPNYLYTRSLLNNHRVKSMSALGLAAIALHGESWEAKESDGRYEATAWMDAAMEGAGIIARDVLTDEDGGYPEGGGYLSYGGLELYPFLWSWHRYGGGAGWTVELDAERLPLHVWGFEGPLEVPDLWTDPWLDRQLDASVRILLADGSAPPTDDSTPGARFFYPAFIQEERAHAPLYAWAAGRAGFSAGGSVNLAPLLLSAYDDALEAAPPSALGWGESQVLFSAGMAVLRSSWETDATIALLLAEHGEAAAWTRTRWGQAVSANAGHEHPDALSVAFWADGEPWLLDSGYLGWDNHHLVNGAENHSILRIDGQGPQGPRAVLPPVTVEGDEIILTDPREEGGWCPGLDGEAWIVGEDLAHPNLRYVRATTSYFAQEIQADLWRSLALLGGRYAVFLDRTQPWTCAARTYTHPLHLACGGTSGGTLTETPHGVLCDRSGNSAQIAVLGPPGMTLSHDTEAIHDAGGWEQRTHAVLEAEVVISKANFLTLVLPGVEEIAEDGEYGLSWSDAEYACHAWSGERRAPGPQLPDLTGINGVACASETEIFGFVQGFPLDEEGEVSFWGSLSEGTLTAWEVAVHDHRDDALVLTLPAIAGLEPDGAITWSEADSRWTVAAATRVRTAPAARAGVAVPRATGLFPGDPPVISVGEAVELRADRSAGDFEARWALLQAPELSQAVLDGALLTPDLPGIYWVELEFGGDRAALRLEAVGEPPLPEPEDTATPDDSPDDSEKNEGECGCATGAQGAWLAWMTGLFALRRRRAALGSRAGR